jgi:hypothetical protein
MNGMPSSSVIERIAGDLEREFLALDHAGAGDQEKGLIEADLEAAQLHAVSGLPRVDLLRRVGAVLPSAASDEALEQRVPVTRRRGELRVELAGHEPGVRRDLDHLDQAPIGRGPATFMPGILRVPGGSCC